MLHATSSIPAPSCLGASRAPPDHLSAGQQGRDLASAIARQQEEIRVLSASLQKMSNQLKLMNASSRMVANDNSKLQSIFD
jgi:hypothetical protein